MIFENVFFTEMLLPFLLVFVVVFAILQKSKILGDGKAQVDAIVGMVVGLILIGVPGPRDIVVGLMPWMAVGVAILLVFFVLYGFAAGDLSSMPNGLKYTFGGLAAVFTVVVVLFVTGWGNKIWDSFGGAGDDIWMNVIMVVIILGVMAVAVFGGKKKS
ncbi:hypothetical protein J4226_04860 [Candidatus Pacearchaeota archaeon]|nr:hypothetical protein [Candidatus Pacearchaeota archaeon]